MERELSLPQSMVDRKGNPAGGPWLGELCCKIISADFCYSFSQEEGLNKCLSYAEELVKFASAGLRPWNALG